MGSERTGIFVGKLVYPLLSLSWSLSPKTRGMHTEAFTVSCTPQLCKVKAEIAEVASNPHSVLLEALHSAGYSGALGQTLMAPESAIAKLNGQVLHDFVVVSWAYKMFHGVLSVAGSCCKTC